MKNTARHVRWTVLLLLGLVLTLAVASSVLGGMPKDTVPLATAQDTPRYVLQEDVTIEAPTATHTPDGYVPPATATLDPSITPSITPTPSNTPYPDGYGVFGVVVDSSGATVAGAEITFTRIDNFGQTDAVLGQMTTNLDGQFRFEWDGNISVVRLELVPPNGYQAVSAEQAPGVVGMVWNASKLDFAGPSRTHTLGPFKFTVDLIPPTPDLPSDVTPTWTPSAFSENERGLPGRIWVSHASTQVGQIAQVVFDTTGWVGGQATIHFDPNLIQAVNAQGNPVDRAESYWYSADSGRVSQNQIDNATGTINLHICKNRISAHPLAVMRFMALEQGSAVLDIVDGHQLNTAEWFAWGEFGVDDGLIQIAPAPTATPTLTATPTATPLSRMVYGSTLDDNDSAVPGAQLTLYRDAGSWVTQASGASGSDGVFRLYTNPIPGDYRLEMTPPDGYSAVSAQLPAGLSGTVLGPDELAFSLGSEAGQIGSFAFTMELVVSSSTSVEGVIWLDANGDNTRQPEEGLSGCELTLSAGELSTQLTKITDAAGHYAFVADPGTYTLALHDPQNRVPDQQRGIDTEALDPGPIDWGNYTRWLPMLSKVKGF